MARAADAEVGPCAMEPCGRRHHVALLAPPYFGHLAPMVALGRQLLDRGWRVSLYTDPEFADHVPEGVEHVQIQLPTMEHEGRSSSAVDRFRDDWRDLAHKDHNGNVAVDFAYQFTIATRERADGSCMLEECHLFVAQCMDHMRGKPPDCVLADFICFLPGEACWLQVFCEARSIALLRLNSQAQPDILAGKNLFTILYLAFAKGLFRQMIGSRSLVRMPKVMAKSNRMMEDRGYRNDPISSYPFTVLSDGNRWPHTIFPTVPSLFFDRWEDGSPAEIQSWMSLVGPVVRSSAGSGTLREKAPGAAHWLESCELPCVYAAFGTLVVMTKDLATRLCEALLPQAHLDAPSCARWRVLWALRREYWDLLPDAVRNSGLLHLEHFVPQVDVLQSREVCMMVCHHGQNSTTECLVAGKPMVGMPFFSDQHHWARIVQRAGGGVRLSKHAPAERIREAIAEVLSNPGYARAAKALSEELCSGRPAAEQVDELMRAAVAREAALRQKSTPQLVLGDKATTAAVARVDRHGQRGVPLSLLLLAFFAFPLLPRGVRPRRLTPAGFAALLGAVALLSNAANLRGQLAAAIRNHLRGRKR